MVFDNNIKLCRMDGMATKHILAMPTSLSDTLTIASHFSDADNFQISTAWERYFRRGYNSTIFIFNTYMANWALVT